MNGKEVANHLNESFNAVHSWIKDQNIGKFEQGPQNKWNTSQHLDHLLQTALLINKAMKMPKFVLKYKFGTPNRLTRSYNEIVDKYLLKLSSIPTGVSSPLKIKSYSLNQKNEILKRFKTAGVNLSATCLKWPEHKLDKYLLPHPH